MRYLSVCSGIEAATCAWHDLGWEPWAFSEIEAFPSAVLAHHYPNVPNLGDMTKFKDWPDATIDLLVGGTPCQSFSVAGLRKGLDDPRGNLMLTYLAIADRYRPRWLVWENVPGVLSSGGGADFGSLLGGMAELGYGFAYRVLDAQYFGVAQRRRRVFVVGHLGDWRRAAAVLFERHSLQGHPAPRREAGKSASQPIASGSKRGSGYRNDADTAENLIAFGGNNTSVPIDVATARNACASASGRMDFETETFIVHALRGEGFDASEDGTGRGTPLVPVPHVETMPTMMNGANTEVGHNARSGHSKDSYIVPVMTLAIRGRGDSHDLEYRTDGTANAILTPNGGRAGMGAGAICFDTTQITSKDNGSNPQLGDPCHPLAAGMHAPAIAFAWQAGGNNSSSGAFEYDHTPTLPKSQTLAIHQAMAVRRLTPRECERLQGFDAIREQVRISACLDHQSGYVTVALSCLRWQSNASLADASEYLQSASAAVSNSITPQADQEPLAVVRVHTNSVASLLEVRSHGKLIWSANSAERSSEFHLLERTENIAAWIALHGQRLALEIRTGKAESLRNIRLSMQVKHGARNALKSGGENVESANVAESDARPEKFTTSILGHLTPTSDSKAETSLCSVLAAISGCIPNETLPERFSLLLDLETPYTLIIVRGKPAADGPRYKALGNSMAVPVMRWIGERIDMVESVSTTKQTEAA